MKRALVFGIGGQDGAYLAQLLVGKGYSVTGTTRQTAASLPNLERLALSQAVTFRSVDPVNADAVAEAVSAVQPDEIYYLSAQSSVFQSFQDPIGTIEGIVLGLTNVLEAARGAAPAARIFNAASGDCFGETSAEAPACEETSFAPRSPYAAAKCGAHHQLAAARLAYGQFACSGFLFNHESPLRAESFAFGKIAAAARRIAAGSGETLKLGNVDVVRDWGWAPEYVEAMWRMLQQPEPLDLVLATGRSRPLSDFVQLCFDHAGLDWREHVELDSGSLRPSDIAVHHADPGRAREVLGWSATVPLEELAARMVAGSA
jgi:GDPmannose 4,6-dehydratase